jgi:hypothetical protein
MIWFRRLPGCLGILLCLSCTAWAQVMQADPSASPEYLESSYFGSELDAQSRELIAPSQSYTFGLQPESLPYESLESATDRLTRPSLGPTPVSQVGLLRGLLGLNNFLDERNLRLFGWLEGGYNGTSTGPGLLSVQTRQNRYSDEYLLNQVGFTFQKTLNQDEFNTGFLVRYFAGADAALGAPKGGIDAPPSNPRFGQDFRDLYVSAHLPILTERGMDVQIGRMNTIIGYNGFLSPYRPFYSSDYQFFYSQDGAFTGVLTNLHVTDQLEVWNGVTLGANTFFTKRSGNSYCYIGQVNYWLTAEKRTRLTGSVYAGPDAIFAAPGMNGNFVTMIELRVQQNWSRYFTQIVQSNMGWDTNTPVGTGAWYGLYTIGIFHLNPDWDGLVRAEWFDDVGGTRTGFDTNYEAITLGLNWHPKPWIEFRPEIRGDFADVAAFGGGGNATTRSLLTGGVSTLIKF